MGLDVLFRAKDLGYDETKDLKEKIGEATGNAQDLDFDDETLMWWGSYSHPMNVFFEDFPAAKYSDDWHELTDDEFKGLKDIATKIADYVQSQEAYPSNWRSEDREAAMKLSGPTPVLDDYVYRYHTLAELDPWDIAAIIETKKTLDIIQQEIDLKAHPLEVLYSY